MRAFLVLGLILAAAGCVSDGSDDCLTGSDRDFVWTEARGYACVDGHLFMHSSAETDVESLRGLEVVYGSVSWLANQELRNLDGLGELQMVGDGLTIQTHGKLTSIDGFNQLSTVTATNPERGLDIAANPALLSVAGFNYLIDPPMALTIRDNAVLQSITGFRSLPAVDSLIISGNDSLTSIDGFDSLTAVNRLVIDSNPNLPTCEAERFAARVSAADVFIFGNNDNLPCD